MFSQQVCLFIYQEEKAIEPQMPLSAEYVLRDLLDLYAFIPFWHCQWTHLQDSETTYFPVVSNRR